MRLGRRGRFVLLAFGPLMEDLRREVFRVALLDAQNGLLRDRVISQGTLSASLVHPREVFKPAILESAASVILLHNHPSGVMRTSGLCGVVSVPRVS